MTFHLTIASSHIYPPNFVAHHLHPFSVLMTSLPWNKLFEHHMDKIGVCQKDLTLLVASILAQTVWRTLATRRHSTIDCDCPRTYIWLPHIPSTVISMIDSFCYFKQTSTLPAQQATRQMDKQQLWKHERYIEACHALEVATTAGPSSQIVWCCQGPVRWN